MDLRHEDGTRCSDLRLDRFLSGELQEGERLRLEAHLAASQACRRRCDALAADRQRFLGSGRSLSGDFSATRNARAPKPGPARRFVIGATLAAAASAAVVFWPSHEQESVRPKGPAFVVHRARNGFVSELTDGGQVRSGDRLRFSFPGAIGRRVFVVGRDGSGLVAPYMATDAGPIVVSDTSRPLDGAVALDGVAGDERLYGFSCDREVPPERMLQAVRSAGIGDVPVVDGCRVHRLRLVKETDDAR
jgi:hypothetical protein